MTAGSTVTLLDEELGLLVPAAEPLPFLDALDDAAREAVLLGSARSLLLRGLAEREGDDVRPAAVLAPLLAPLAAGGPQVLLVCPLPDADPSLTVLRPLPDGLVHLHDIGEDGVHVLTLLEAEEARDRLRAALDPTAVAGAAQEPVADVLALLEQPDAAVRVQHRSGDLDLTVVTAGGRCWSVDATEQVRARGVTPADVRPLEAEGLEALLDRLLEPEP